MPKKVSSNIDALHETGKILTYDLYIYELKYIQKSLEYIDNSIKNDLKNIESNFQEKLLNTDSKDLVNLINKEHKSIKMNILEGLFIRQISLLERFFVNLSKAIYHESIRKISFRKAIYPPNYYENKNKHFTDSIKAIKYLKETFAININNQKELEIYKNMIQIRNQLAHGNTILRFESLEQINTYNKHDSIGIILIPLNDNSQFAHLNIETIPHIKLTESFIKLIKHVRKLSYDKYLFNYFPKPD